MPSRIPSIALALALLVSSLVPAAAVAQTDEERELAAALFRESADAYRVGNMELAVTLLRRAYELDPAPVLQYNLARALEGMGDTDGAIEAYERYLELDPDAEDRATIEERLETLHDDRARAEAAAAAETDEFLSGADAEGADGEDADGPMPPPREVSAIPWAIAGLGAVVLVSAVVTGVLADGRHDDALGTTVHEDRVRLADEADRLALITNVNLAVGGVLLLVGGVWGLVDAVHVARERDVTLRLGPGQLALRARF